LLVSYILSFSVYLSSSQGKAHRFLNVLLITSQKLAKVKCGNCGRLAQAHTYLWVKRNIKYLCMQFALVLAMNKNGNLDIKKPLALRIRNFVCFGFFGRSLATPVVAPPPKEPKMQRLVAYAKCFCC